MNTSIEQPHEDRIFDRFRNVAGQIHDLMGEVEALQNKIRVGDLEAMKNSEKALAALRGWMKRAYELEDLHHERTGQSRGGAELDLGAARASIGGRLARLRAAGGAGAVSGQSE
ncbi:MULTISPECIES: hypothetical protein [Donghicola]|jgi:hypothetical protein|uniref:hypothetical protein n=1 Tax=Donghicola TaxID=393277 RepID=UPI001FE406A4|nr:MULTISPECIES: hypothetical protein [Donghicola]MCT4576207.1 hypothetical protein [Donghicola sp.]